MYYSIIIPIYNEIRTLEYLLLKLKIFYKLGHEVIIIDDGSTDGSLEILEKIHFITLIKFKRNKGKGLAIKRGLEYSKIKK